MAKQNLSSDLIQELTSFRKELHAHPEVSGDEKETSKRIIDFLAKHDLKAERCGQYGVLLQFEGAEAGECTLIRGDSDALPIQEVNEFDHRSNKPGVSHKCGHDGHSTILLGLAILLKHHPIRKGRVLLLWQPAEENGEGAREMLEQNLLKEIKIHRAIALHNLPGFPLGSVVTKKGAFTSAVKSLIIVLNGKTAHAAEPEHGINPALGISKILQACTIRTRNVPESPDFFLITPVYVTMGDKAYGISAGYAEVHLTIRSWTNEIFDKETKELTQAIHAIAEEEQLEIKTSWTQEFHANENNDEVVDEIVKAAEQLEFKHIEKSEPFKWGEDFGLFTEQFPGAMFGIGSGEDCPALHNPDYDFPDQLIAVGSELFNQVIQNNH
jgi:amidohydrolase